MNKVFARCPVALLFAREREPEVHYGATALPGGGVHFRVWAPEARSLALQLAGCAPLPMHALPAKILSCSRLRPGPETAYSFVFEMAACVPIRFRDRNRMACMAHPRSSIPIGLRLVRPGLERPRALRLHLL